MGFVKEKIANWTPLRAEKKISKLKAKRFRKGGNKDTEHWNKYRKGCWRPNARRKNKLRTPGENPTGTNGILILLTLRKSSLLTPNPFSRKPKSWPLTMSRLTWDNKRGVLCPAVKKNTVVEVWKFAFPDKVWSVLLSVPCHCYKILKKKLRKP